jgi:hypothetical protein
MISTILLLLSDIIALKALVNCTYKIRDILIRIRTRNRAHNLQLRNNYICILKTYANAIRICVKMLRIRNTAFIRYI